MKDYFLETQESNKVYSQSGHFNLIINNPKF